MRRNKTTWRSLTRTVAWTLGVIGVAGLGVAAVWARAWFSPAPPRDRMVPSPNCDLRPTGTHIDCIVLHATAMDSAEAAIAHLVSPASNVSAHFVIAKDGAITQLVPLNMRAWHAGASELAGVEHVNDFSIGIELDNPNDGHTPYPPAQLRSLLRVIRYLRATYKIPDERIVSHAEIARPIGRKSDPLGLDIDQMRELSQ